MSVLVWLFFLSLLKHSKFFGRMFQISWCWRLEGLNWLINNMFGNNLIKIRSRHLLTIFYRCFIIARSLFSIGDLYIFCIHNPRNWSESNSWIYFYIKTEKKITGPSKVLLVLGRKSGAHREDWIFVLFDIRRVLKG